MLNFLAKQWFLLSLVACLVIGFVFADALQLLGDHVGLRYALVFCVMFLMAWSLETTYVFKSLKRPKSAIIAVFTNLGLLPLAAWPLVFLLNESQGAGLVVTAATPCTLVTATVWTRRAGGNEVVSMLTTVITNSICFIVTPLWIGLIISSSTAAIDVVGMINKLFWLILLPMCLAQVTRVHQGVANWATTHKPSLSIVAQIGILLMIVIGSIQTGNRAVEGSGFDFWWSIGFLTVICSILHFAVLFFGIFFSRWLGCEPQDQIAVGIAGSQKTLMVGLATSIELGVSVLPMVVFHTVQLIGDTPVADWFRKKHFEKPS